MNRDAEPERLNGVAIVGRSGTYDLSLRNGIVASLTPTDRRFIGFLVPALTDVHVHLDKTLVADRLPGIPATLQEAIDMAAQDAEDWSESDVRRRASSGVHRAWVRGTARMRSHVDWPGPEVPLAWPVLQELREDNRGKVELQLASLTPLDVLAEAGQSVARRVARDRGVLGAFVYGNEDLPGKIARAFDLADRYDLALDFHVDESLAPEARGFDAIVREAAVRGVGRRVLCSHVCALSVRPEDEVRRLLDETAAAGITLCVLPTTNAWLQDHAPGRTPRHRGLAPLHEAREAGVPVLLASDNVQDAFYPWGNYDLWDVFRNALTWAQLDPDAWLGAVTGPSDPFPGGAARIVEGGPADFIVFYADTLEEVVSDPRCLRDLYRNGTLVREASDIGDDWE